METFEEIYPDILRMTESAVIKHAKFCSSVPCLDLDDLRQAGYIAAFKGYCSYNAESGASLGSWLYLKINYGIVDECRRIVRYRSSSGKGIRESMFGEESLDRLIGEDESVLYDVVGVDDQNVKHFENSNLVSAMIDTLSPQERYVMFERYWECEKFKVIGRKIGVSESRAHQIHTRGADKLRRKFADAI